MLLSFSKPRRYFFNRSKSAVLTLLSPFTSPSRIEPVEDDVKSKLRGYASYASLSVTVSIVTVSPIFNFSNSDKLFPVPFIIVFAFI